MKRVPHDTKAQAAPPVRPADCRRICRCNHCGGLQFQFGNLSAHLEPEAFLSLANKIHQAATDFGPKLVDDERVVIPFATGSFSLLVDAGELTDLHHLMKQGLAWLEGPVVTAALPVN